MIWKRRIVLYLVGFGLGAIIVAVFFGDKALMDWTPSSRVKSFLTKVKTIDADSSLICRLNCEHITVRQIQESVKNGDVDFDKSLTNKEPCREYYLNLTVSGKQLGAYFSACLNDSTARLLKVNLPAQSGSCNCP
ncbi:MAG: hypothetical protein Fur0041_02640 [Bacteroidia bacterium]